MHKLSNDITIESLVEAFKVDTVTATQAMQVLRGAYSVKELGEIAPKAFGQLHHGFCEPLYAQQLALNTLLGCFGVEHIDNGEGADYLNTGDTYSVTLLWDNETNEILLTSWGDWFEDYENSHPQTASFERFEITLPYRAVQDCHHQGSCDDEVDYWVKHIDLSHIDPEDLKTELKEYGAWNDEELSDHDENLKRIVWIAAGNIQEGLGV
jgi:hypothetical protein